MWMEAPFSMFASIADMRRKVTYFSRAPGVGHSIERIFSGIRPCLSNGFEASRYSVPFYGANPLKMLFNGLCAHFRQGDVNHIEGDIHYVAMFLRRRKTVLTIHDCGVLDLQVLAGLRGWLYRMLWFRIPCRRVGRIVAISEFTRTRLLRYVRVKPQKITVIPACVPAGYEPSVKEFNCRCPRILHVGTQRHKNLGNLVRGLAGKQCELRIIGKLTGNQRRVLDGSGVWYNNDEEISDAQMIEEYRRCDIVAFVSYFEGFGMPILEGQAVGRPVITSNISPMCDVAGDGAVLVDPYDPSSVSEGIDRIIHDASYRAKVVEEGRRNVERYRAERVARMYEELYSEIAV